MGRSVLLALLISCAAIAPFTHRDSPASTAILPECRPPGEPPDIGAVFVQRLTIDHAVLVFQANVREGNVSRFILALDGANKAGVKYVVLQLDTLGGNVDEGRRMKRAIEESKVPVYCVVTAEAASAGFYIFQACAQRFMLPGAKLLAHEMYRPWVEHLTRYDARQVADDLEHNSQEFIDFEAHRLGITRDSFIERTKGRDWEMGSVEALAVGAADEIVEDLDLTRPDRPALPRPSSPRK